MMATFWTCVAFASCGHAGAAVADAPSGTPRLLVERVGPDSARVIARWAAACDAKGCADAYGLTWTAGGVTVRTMRVVGLTDTVRVLLPAVGDSVGVVVAVTANRRGQMGPTRSAALWVVNRDAPPPGVDSLKVDTTAVVDSFPETAWTLRDVTGANVADGTLSAAVGDSLPLCLLARNVFSGEVVLIFDPATTALERAAVLTACEPARRAVLSERSG
jgi:hypothetical protein